MFQNNGRGSNLREAILKRLPFPRPRSSSDSAVQTAPRKLCPDFPSSVGGVAGSSNDVHLTGTEDSGNYSCHNVEESSEFASVVPSVKKKDRIIESEKTEAASDNLISLSETLDNNGISKISNASLSLSGSNSSTGKSQHSLSSCSSCCSKLSIDGSNEKKSPVIHVKLYSSSQEHDGTGTSTRRSTHVLCHKVPLTSLSCCSECRSDEHGSSNGCNCLCSSLSSALSLECDSDKKSMCSSLVSNGVCGCAEEMNCTCNKGSQITCEVDLVFEGENVKNVPMKNEIMEADLSGSIGMNCM